MFINHMTFFVACVAIHEKRIDDRRHCCTCTPMPEADDPEFKNGSGCYRCCCSGRKPSSIADTESLLERIPRKILTRTILTTPVKIISVLLFFAYVGCAIWQIVSVRLDLFQEDDIKSGSYFSDFHAVNKLAFPNIPFITFSPDEADDTDELIRQQLVGSNLYDIVANAVGDKLVENQTVWLNAYSESAMYNATSEASFVEGLKKFMKVNEQFKYDVVFDESETRIQMFRFSVQAKGFTSSKSLISLEKDIDGNDGLDNMNIAGYAPEFMLVDSIRPSLWEMIRFAGIQLGWTVIMMLFYKNRILFIIEAAFWYIVCCVGLIGFAGLFGVYITSLAMIVFVTSLTYITNIILFSFHAYSISEGTGPTRVHNMLNTCTSHLFCFSFGTFCGLMVLFVEESYVFITVFKMFGVTSVTAMVSACFFIPTLLVFTARCDNSSNENGIISHIDLSGFVDDNIFTRTEKDQNGVANGNHNIANMANGKNNMTNGFHGSYDNQVFSISGGERL